MPREVPLAPIQGATETSDAFERRQLQWWRESDIALRFNQAERCTQWQAMLEDPESFVGQTITKLEEAWVSFDAKLAALASAMAPRMPTDDDVVRALFVDYLRLGTSSTAAAAAAKAALVAYKALTYKPPGAPK